MDLLFKEYASPFLLLDEIIGIGRFCDFLNTFRKQKEEREMWDYYIHKIPAWNEMTWEEFKRNCQSQTETVIPTATPEQLETTVSNTFDMLNNFEP